MDKVKEAIQEIRTTNRLDDKLLKCKGVIGVDVDYKQVKGQKTDTLSITVYVKKKLVKEELSADEAVPEMIHGIPTDVVECPNVWPSQASSEQMAEEVKTEQAKTPTLDGGLSISNQYNLGSYGTLGIILMSNGAPTALSCAHVMVYPPPQPGQGVIEPGGPKGGLYPADSIGNVSVAEYNGPNNVDAALAPISGRAYSLATVLNIGKINDWGTGFVGNDVIKMGARTGRISGKISSTTFTWQTTDPNLGPITLRNQIKINGQFALPGDSGAAVINTTHQMVGMVQGGSTGPIFFTVCNTSSDLQKIIPP